MKRRAAALFLLLFVPAALAVTARAALLDPCAGTSGPGSYQNLAPPGADLLGWSDPPDGSYLCQQSNRSRASAVYHVPGAREVVVAIYSRYGSRASREGDELVRGGEGYPLRYHAASGEVYCQGRRMAYDPELGSFVFLAEEGAPSGLSDYGLSLYASADGSDYSPASCQLVSAENEGGGSYWYEVYEAALEPGTNYLKVTLTDQSSIQLVGREERYEFEETGGLSLARVEVTSEDPPEGGQGAEEEPPHWEAEAPGPGDGEESAPPSQGDEPSFPEEGDSPPPPLSDASAPSQDWGPNTDPQEGPAFQEETEAPSQSQPPASSSQAQPPASSQAKPGRQGSSSASPPEDGAGKPSEDSAAAPEEDGKLIHGKREISPYNYPPAERRVPLWYRVLDPEAMTMLFLSAALIAAAFRILWHNDK